MTIGGRAVEICRLLTEDVGRIAPDGIGRWDRAWTIVDAPTADFMAALSAWESEPKSETAKQAVRDTYRGVLDAWREAVEEYRREGVGR